ncbi:MAG TPA: hypothetical protein VJ734_06755, partial [Nitrosospira sp.]|nr:hypothetical protein [Nitrosospira sp.]
VRLAERILKQGISPLSEKNNDAAALKELSRLKPVHGARQFTWDGGEFQIPSYQHLYALNLGTSSIFYYRFGHPSLNIADITFNFTGVPSMKNRGKEMQNVMEKY